MKTNFIIIRPRKDCEPVKVDDIVYNYFNVINDKYQVIDTYDFIDIRGDVRLDVMDGDVRIFCAHRGDELHYDKHTHAVIVDNKNVL